MAAAVTLKGGIGSINRANKVVQFQVSIACSGTYAASGGDTLDLRGFVPGNAVPRSVRIYGQGGALYQYVPGTTLGNGKIKVLIETTVGTNTLLSEHSNTTYVAGVSGDTIVGDVVCELFKAA